MSKTSALSSGGETIHTRTTADTVESQVAVIGLDGADTVIGGGDGNTDTLSPAGSIGLNVRGLSHIFNNTAGQWERIRNAWADGLPATGLLGVALMGWNGTTHDRLKSDTTFGLDVDVTRVPAPLSTAGSGTEATALRVTVATDSTGVLSVDDNGGSLTVDIGAGTNNIGDVDVLTLPGSLAGKAEDVASSPADVGLPILGVRNDTPTALTDTDGDYTMVAVDQYGRVQTVPQRSLPKTIGVSGSLGITTAATWAEKAVWAVPSLYLFVPKTVRCAVTTAATRTLVMVGKQLATFNPGTNSFASTATVSTPDFYDRLFYRVPVTHSATATTITATYTDQDGNTGNSTGGLVIPASAAGGSWFEFVLATNDFGVRAVTAVSDTANPTSVVDEIWGCRTLLEDLGPANTPHIAYLGEGLKVPSTETVLILFNAAATTAQQRFAQVLGDLILA